MRLQDCLCFAEGALRAWQLPDYYRQKQPSSEPLLRDDRGRQVQMHGAPEVRRLSIKRGVNQGQTPLGEQMMFIPWPCAYTWFRLFSFNAHGPGGSSNLGIHCTKQWTMVH